ncbi:hypothetical protein D3C71_1745660 [compost metagenome]
MLVANDIKCRQRPELRAVLAHPPALILGHALLERLLQETLGPPFGAVLSGEKQREMPTDHLIGAVALDPLSTCIPRDHPTRRVQHVDRVVHDRLNQLFIAIGGHDRVIEAVS